MTIGIDIDDTITCSSELIVEYAKKYFKSDDNDFIRSILIERTIEGQLYDFYNDCLIEMVSNYQLKENAKEVIEKLKARGHRIIAITARGYTINNGMIEVTNNYFERHGISFDKMVFRAVEKSSPCLVNKVDLMIDDSISVLKKVNDDGIKTLLFTSVNNKDDEINFDRVNNWTEAFEYIEKLAIAEAVQN